MIIVVLSLFKILFWSYCLNVCFIWKFCEHIFIRLAHYNEIEILPCHIRLHNLKMFQTYPDIFIFCSKESRIHKPVYDIMGVRGDRKCEGVTVKKAAAHPLPSHHLWQGLGPGLLSRASYSWLPGAPPTTVHSRKADSWLSEPMTWDKLLAWDQHFRAFWTLS